MAYWSMLGGPYHTLKECPKGGTISAGLLKEGDPPSGKKKCDVCEEMETKKAAAKSTQAPAQ